MREDDRLLVIWASMTLIRPFGAEAYPDVTER